MKLLFVLPEYGPDVQGGIATYYRHTIAGLLRAGCSVDVCVPTRDGSTGVTREQSGLRTIHAGPMDHGRAAARFSHLAAVPEVRSSLAAAFGAWEACNRGRDYDLVEVTDWALLFAPWLLAEGGPPIVVQLHGSSGQVNYHDPLDGYELSGTMTRLAESALLARADELQSGGRDNAAEWSRLLNRPTSHMWPAWSPESDPAGAAPANLGAEAFGLVVGRIQKWKGPEVLCQAVRRLEGRAPKLIWVGRDHPFRQLSQSMSAYLKNEYPDVWGKTIDAVGEMSRQATAATQAAASFVVVPSTWDVFNYTAAEAMWAGKVVICSEGAGAVHLIEHGKNGFRFPAGDTARLAELLSAAGALSAGDREAIGKSAHATIKSELNVDRIVTQRIEHFQRLTSGRQTRKGPHPWLDTFFGASDVGPRFEFLSALPLREILRHATKRGLHRLRSGWR